MLLVWTPVLKRKPPISSAKRCAQVIDEALSRSYEGIWKRALDGRFFGHYSKSLSGSDILIDELSWMDSELASNERRCDHLSPAIEPELPGDDFWKTLSIVETHSSIRAQGAVFRKEYSARWRECDWHATFRLEVVPKSEVNPPFVFSFEVRLAMNNVATSVSTMRNIFETCASAGYHGNWQYSQTEIIGVFTRYLWDVENAISEVARIDRGLKALDQAPSGAKKSLLPF